MQYPILEFWWGPKHTSNYLYIWRFLLLQVTTAGAQFWLSGFFRLGRTFPGPVVEEALEAQNAVEQRKLPFGRLPYQWGKKQGL